MLNQYFDIMVKEIIPQNGTIYKFIGDCVMSVFRGDYHLDRAIDSSLSIKNKLSNLPPDHEFRPEVSIGINSRDTISVNISSTTQ